MNAALLLTMLFGVIDRADRIKTLLQTAQAEGRDVTAAELDKILAEDDQARSRLEQAIADARKP